MLTVPLNSSQSAPYVDIYICHLIVIAAKGPLRFLTEARMNMTKSGLACVYCV